MHWNFAWSNYLHKSEPYVWASLIVSLGGLINGYDTGSIGAVTLMPAFEAEIAVLTPIMRGFAVSLIMLTGIAPSVFAGYLADRWGRLPIVALGASVFLVGVIMQAAAHNLTTFCVGRGISGLGQGVWLSNVSVYITEIAPKAKRGALVSTPQLMAALGICLGYFTCYGTARLESTFSWRIPYIVQAGLAFTLAVSCITVLPSSPRWLVLHGRYDDALEAVVKLNIPRAEAEKDILKTPELHSELEGSFLKSLLGTFGKQYRSRTILAFFVLGMVQLSGIDGVLYYAPILFAKAGLPEQTAGFLASGVSAILMLAVSIPAMVYADAWNRRTCVITGGILLSGSMFLVGSLYAAGVVRPHGAARWIVIIAIFVFALSYCVTWAVVGKIYASEVQPAKTRAAANCLAQGLGFFTNWLVAFATPVFLAKSAYGAYFLFGGLSLGTLAVLYLYMPETRGVPLESIQELFRQQPEPGTEELSHPYLRLTSLAKRLVRESSTLSRIRD